MVAPSFSTIQKQQQQQQQKSLSPKTTLTTTITTTTTTTTTIIKEKYKNEKNTTTSTSNTNKPLQINSINNKNGLINESSSPTLSTLETNVNSNELFVSCEKLSNNNHHHQNEDDIVVSLIQTERVNIQKKLGA
ncbi:hypothetical protein ACTFIR_001662 [Dictyostelium discoideum]